ncbi:MAG: Fe-S cluster assembly protein SufD [Opitutaceae bacterium]|nr:Fe-S cluster assembly protein SufD [Opitutaceae bacterium]MBP9913912.1 Fe-S cluster assembly protein SufD [Opitutaceae bacterium]
MSAVPVTTSSSDFTSERFVAHIANRHDLPAWWLEIKKAAWNQYLALPLPTRTDERWRYSNIKGIDLAGFVLPGQPAPHIPHLPDFPHTAALTFSNRQIANRSALPAELIAQGVVFAPLDEALREHGDLVRQYFQKHPVTLGSDKFVALNTAFCSTGALLYVPRGVEIALPFVVEHTLAGDHMATFPHTLVILENQAKATLVEFFASTETATAHFVSGVNDLHAAAGAHLTYVGVQNWSDATQAFQSNSIAAGRDARIFSLNLHLGGRQARHESQSRLLAPGAHSEMLSLTVAHGTQEFDQRTLQTHAAPHTSSNLLYKNVLLDQARTIFSGLIVVEPDAQKTDAYQSNRNLMLSEHAEANSLPGLEIEANDVRCTHGATTARLDREQQFYLEARGITPTHAHELLVFGFFEEVLNKLADEHLHDALSNYIQSKFKQ